MIVGLGVDLVTVSSFAQLLEVKDSAFKRETFTERELQYAEEEALGSPSQHLAARFAAKEAALKALDQAASLENIQPPPLALTDLEVVRDHRSRPSLALHGDADELASSVGADRVLLTLTHDGDAAVAVVVFERL